MAQRPTMKSVPFARKAGVILVYTLFYQALTGQNLVPNPSFEIYTTCPSALGGVNPLECVPWEAVAGTSDYFNACGGPSSPVDVPYNFQGFQYALTGDAYGGIYCRTSGNLYREYFRVELTEVLEENACYRVGFHVNLANETCGIDRIGALLSEDPIANPLGMIPQIDWTGQFLSDTLNWFEIYGYIIATGGEAYITIGNFYDDPETILDTACTIPFPFNYSYYYVEDVSVIPYILENIDIDLGGPVVVCDEYLIDPGLPDINFNWSTGDIGPTLTVFESGVYTGTGHFECNVYNVEISVTIPTDTPIDIGPEEVYICEGDVFEINLDPSAGNYTWQDGSTATTYFITTPGTYSVTVDNGCFVNDDAITVHTETLPEPFFLGPDLPLCPGDAIEIELDPEIGDIVWQDNSTVSSYIIELGGTYAVTITNACGAITDDIEVTEMQPPEFSFPEDVMVLCEGQPFIVSVDPFMGEYEWQDGSMLPSYVVTEEGTYFLTVTNPCGIAIDFFSVTDVPIPFVILPPDITTCQGDTILLDAGMMEGDILWQNQDTTQTFEVTSTGVYSLMLTNACGYDLDSVQIVFLPIPLAPQLGPDVTLCPGQFIVLSAESPGSNHLWSDQSIADTLMVDDAGTYFVEVYNTCGSETDTIQVSVNADPPDVVLPADFALCQGTSTSLDAGLTGVTYLWNDGSIQGLLQINQPGTYSLTVTNACGTDADTVIVADGGPAPSVTLGPDTALCENTVILLQPVFTDVESWMWQDSSTQATFELTSPGTYSIQVANSCGTSMDSIHIEGLTSVPALTLGPDVSLCPGDSVLLSISAPGVDIVWNNGSMQPAIWINDNEMVYASITNSCGSSSDTVAITVLPDLPVMDLGIDQSICPGEVIVFSPGLLGVDYMWHDGSTADTFAATQQGWVILTIANDCAALTDSVYITESTEGPQVDLGPDLDGCAGDTLIIHPGVSGVDYLWQDGTTQSTFYASISGTVIVTVSNSCGQDSDTLVVMLEGLAPVSILGADTTICAGLSLTLTAIEDGISSIMWQDGSVYPSLLVSAPGTYSFFAMNECGSLRDTINVNLTEAPVPFDLGPDTIVCPGISILLFAPTAASVFHWQDGSNTNPFVADAEGTYWLRVENECGEQSDSLVLMHIDEVIQFDLDPIIPWCPGDIFLLDAAQPFVAEYTWNTGQTANSISISAPGVYAVSVNSLCDTGIGNVEVIALPDCASEISFGLPTVFSPNGDNINDIFTLPYHTDLQIESNSGEIFDRWGNQIYRSSSVPFTWDGTFKGLYMQPGVYVYVIDIQYINAGVPVQQRLVGNITILR